MTQEEGLLRLLWENCAGGWKTELSLLIPSPPMQRINDLSFSTAIKDSRVCVHILRHSPAGHDYANSVGFLVTRNCH